MKPIVRKTVFSFFANGVIFTLIMMGFHHVQEEKVSFWRYATQFLVIGSTMSYLTYSSLKKQENQEH